jgi:hypothetical protein
MKPKTLLILFILLCTIASITFFVINREKPSLKTSRMGEMLFKDLPLNDINTVQIQTYEKDNLQTFRLNKSESEWVVEDLFKYPADFKSLTELVQKLKDAKIGRHFEGSADTLSRLALHHPSQLDIPEDEKAIRIQLLDKDQKSLADLLVGKQRESSTGNEAHYLRPTEENIVYLVDQTFRLIGKQPRDWIKTDLLNIPSKDIEKITCFDPTNQSVIYTVMRPERGASPEFQSPVDNKSIKSQTVDLLFESLSSLRVQDVAGHLQDISEETMGFGILPYLDFQLFDGMLYRIYPGKKANEKQNSYYLKLEVLYVKPENNLKESILENSGETATETVDQNEIENSREHDFLKNFPVEINPEESAIEAYGLDRKLSTWVYIISEWEHESMITDPDKFFDDSDPSSS